MPSRQNIQVSHADSSAGAAGGYNFTILPATDPAFMAQGAPAAPGKTGATTCTIDQRGNLNCIDTPGASHARDVMWMRISALTANAISMAILNQGPPDVGEADIKAYLARRTTVQEAFAVLAKDSVTK